MSPDRSTSTSAGAEASTQPRVTEEELRRAHLERGSDREVRAAGPGPDQESLRRAYLDLLKLALCDLGGAQTMTVSRSGDGRDRDSQIFSRELAPDELPLRVKGADWPLSGITMIGLLRLDDLQSCVEQVVADGVEGDLVEAGAWRGGASILMRATLDSLGAENRTVCVADSFRGLPPPDLERFPQDRELDLSRLDFLAAPLEQVQSHFARFGCESGLEFVEGFFDETLPGLRDRRWSVARLDGDTYESTRLALDCLYPGLSVGGYLVVDDYQLIDECRQAVDDYRREHGITEPIEEVDWNGVRWRRETEGAAPVAAEPRPPAAAHGSTRAVGREADTRVPTERELELRRELNELRGPGGPEPDFVDPGTGVLAATPDPDGAVSVSATGPRPGPEALRAAYLDLLELTLSDLAGASSMSVDWTNEGLAFSRELLPEQVELRANGKDWPLSGVTMVGLTRLRDLRSCVEDVVTDGVEGDLIEAGSWRGGASIMMRATLDSLGAEDRTVWVADSFQGFPGGEDTGAAEQGAARSPTMLDFLSIPLEEVQANFARFGCDRGVRFVPGFFEQTMPGLRGRRWSLVRLDGDSYEATRDLLDSLYPGLAAGGHLIVDDYGALEVCRMAVDDYRSEHGITEPLEQVDWTCVRWRRQDAPAPAESQHVAAPGPSRRIRPAAAGPSGSPMPTIHELLLERELAGLRGHRGSRLRRMARRLRRGAGAGSS